jgi:hypothetical protein
MATWPTLLLSTLAGFFGVMVAITFLTHWLTAVFAAFGKGPFSAPHKSDITAVVLTTVFHPVPWLLIAGAYFGMSRLLGPPLSEGWKWFCGGAGASLLYYSALLLLIFRRVRKNRSKKNSASGMI